MVRWTNQRQAYPLVVPQKSISATCRRYRSTTRKPAGLHTMPLATAWISGAALRVVLRNFVEERVIVVAVKCGCEAKVRGFETTELCP